MTVDASRSCLSLGTCVGSVIRQIVHMRVLLTASAPPALLGERVGWFAGASFGCDDAFLGVILPAAPAGRSPYEARQFAGDCSGDDIGRLPGPDEPAIARAQPHLSLPGDVADRLWLPLLSQQQLPADPGRKAVAPGGFDQQPTDRTITGLGEAAASDAGTARIRGWHQPELGHEMA